MVAKAVPRRHAWTIAATTAHALTACVHARPSTRARTAAFCVAPTMVLMTEKAIVYASKHCESVACEPSHNCNDHGTCMNGVCKCDLAWTGAACERINCNDHGEGVNGVCKCDKNYKGTHCETLRCND